MPEQPFQTQLPEHDIDLTLVTLLLSGAEIYIPPAGGGGETRTEQRVRESGSWHPAGAGAKAA